MGEGLKAMLRSCFMTARSGPELGRGGAPTGKQEYAVVMKFATIQEMQAAHRLLLEVGATTESPNTRAPSPPITGLVEALEPFAAHIDNLERAPFGDCLDSDSFKSTHYCGGSPGFTHRITVGDLRRARTALEHARSLPEPAEDEEPCPRCGDSGYAETYHGSIWTGEHSAVSHEICDCACGEDVLREQRARPLPVDGGWRPIETAPRDKPIKLRVIYEFEAEWCGGLMNEAEEQCGGWHAIRGDIPPCWTDDVCWESNENGDPSAGPSEWKLL